MAFGSPLSRIFTKDTSDTSALSNTRRQQVAKMTLKADLDHIALACHDSTKLHAFYRDILQFDHMQMTHAPFPSVRVSDITIVDFMQTDKPHGLGANHMCFSVSKNDMDDLRVRLTAAGYDVGDAKLRGGAKGRGWSVYIRDPEENLLEFRYYD